MRASELAFLLSRVLVVPGRLLRKAGIDVAHTNELVDRFLGRPFSIRAEGIRLRGSVATLGMLRALKANQFEPYTLELFRSSIRPGMTVVDVGAGIGIYSLFAGQALHGTGHVHAYEPNPRLYGMLVENISANGFDTVIRPIQAAVGDTNGTAEFYLAKNPFVSSLFVPKQSRKRMILDVVTLDHSLSGKQADVIKIDVEGAESRVLAGMTESMARSRKLRLIIEYNPSTLRRAGYLPWDLVRALRGMFRRVLAIDEGERSLLPLSEEIIHGEKKYNLYCEEPLP